MGTEPVGIEPVGIGPIGAGSVGGYSESGVPSFDYVRDRIENRAATAVGAGELARETPDAAELDRRMAERDEAGRDRLEQIRRSMRGE